MDAGKRNITTMFQANRKGFPDEVKKIGNTKANLYKFFWDDGRTVLNSFVVNTKSSGRQNVLMLFTIQPVITSLDNDRFWLYTKSSSFQ